MNMLLTGGPVQTMIVIYSEFSYYKGSVYKHTYGFVSIGLHALEMVGYGTTEDGTDY